jgi:hypothetical protein
MCMKIPATQGVITIWGHKNDGRNLERVKDQTATTEGGCE